MIATRESVQSVPLFVDWEIRGGIWINGQNFLDEVINTSASIKAVTYTCDATILRPLDKIITSVLIGIPSNGAQVRIGKNVHTKLYIVDDEYYVGSFNLRRGNMLHELMVQIHDKSQCKSIKIYFDRLWSLCKNNKV